MGPAAGMLISFIGDAPLYCNTLLSQIRLAGGFFEWQISVKYAFDGASSWSGFSGLAIYKKIVHTWAVIPGSWSEASFQFAMQ